jgi:hypothetical protein
LYEHRFSLLFCAPRIADGLVELIVRSLSSLEMHDDVIVEVSRRMKNKDAKLIRSYALIVVSWEIPW